MSGYALKDFTAGQSLVVGRNPHRNSGETPSEVTVLRVGRRWVTLDNGDRFDPADMEIDGGESPSTGNVYWNRVQFDNAQEKRKLWNELRELMRGHWTVPAELTVGALRQFVHCMRKATKP